MAVPRNRHSNARKNSKRAHHAKKPKSMAACPNCNSPKIPHTLCSSCGTYNGRTVVAKEA
ncbi:50S ribosomal protein L32 [Candidatus Rubidus massiliensis]|nr:MAG: 50S ribosomal protein L32 [Chlamydia sp. 32-24]CDZ79560.1 50S ribosomal protein L32 [Candidatus Rubidus massiliensis]